MLRKLLLVAVLMFSAGDYLYAGTYCNPMNLDCDPSEHGFIDPITGEVIEAGDMPPIYPGSIPHPTDNWIPPGGTNMGTVVFVARPTVSVANRYTAMPSLICNRSCIMMMRMNSERDFTDANGDVILVADFDVCWDLNDNGACDRWVDAAGNTFYHEDTTSVTMRSDAPNYLLVPDGSNGIRDIVYPGDGYNYLGMRTFGFFMVEDSQ